MEPEIILHPENGGVQFCVTGIDPANVGLPVFTQRTYAQVRLIALDIHHGPEMLMRCKMLAKVCVHDTVPLIH